jgi:hypothetical protein
VWLRDFLRKYEGGAKNMLRTKNFIKKDFFFFYSLAALELAPLVKKNVFFFYPSAVYLSLYSSTVEHNTVNIMIDVRFILGAFNMCIKLKDL